VLRERKQLRIDASFPRPVLIAEEAREVPPAVLSELRLLASARLDSHIVLTVVQVRRSCRREGAAETKAGRRR